MKAWIERAMTTTKNSNSISRAPQCFVCLLSISMTVNKHHDRSAFFIRPSKVSALILRACASL